MPIEILFVEDNAETQKSIRDAFMNDMRDKIDAGELVLTYANSGREALEYLKRGCRPTAVVSEFVLRGEPDGLDFLHQAQAIVRDARFVLFTACPLGELKRIIEPAGAMYLSKDAVAMKHLPRKLMEILYAADTQVRPNESL
jgi:CheY-like chemotaxis protein